MHIQLNKYYQIKVNSKGWKSWYYMKYEVSEKSELKTLRIRKC